MAEYIERERLLEVLARNFGYTHGGSVMKQLIETQPAADVAPVSHGKWVKTDNGVCYWYECSLCHERTPFGRYKNEWFSDYCPYCGAEVGEGFAFCAKCGRKLPDLP